MFLLNDQTKDCAADFVLWASLFPVFKGAAEIKGRRTFQQSLFFRSQCLGVT